MSFRTNFCASRLWILFIEFGLMSLAFAALVPSESLCQPANHQSKFLGNVVGNYIPSDFDKYWNQVTPENAGKWGLVGINPDTNSWYWSHLDSIYDYAIGKGYPFKFHNLVWKQQQPEWMDNLDPAQQKKMVEAWIRLCGERYPKASYIDVVNEPIQKPALYKNALGGDGSTGWDWVIWSFQKARQYFPNTKLLINDYDILSNRENTNEYIKIINLLKERNLIDEIGCQGHGLEKIDTAIVRANLNLLEATGLPIYISEFDIDEANDSAQMAVYQRLFPIFWDDPGVEGITLWGYIQGETWRMGTYLVRTDGTERPALAWMLKYASSHQAGTSQQK